MRILVVDDDELTRASVKAGLEDPHLRGASQIPNQVMTAGTLSEAEASLQREIFDIAFIDIRLGPYHKNGGIDLLKAIRKRYPTTVVIMMTSVEDFETIERCLLAGAADYIFKPFDFQSVHLLMIKAQAIHRHFRKEQSLRAQAGDRAVTPIHLKSKSPGFQKVLEQAERLKGKDLSVLLLGETGVGKEVMARYLWTLEDDDSRSFAAINSVGLPKELVESELFGHVKGAFTGATENKIGKFQFAHRGDFFLDELALMPPEVQQKLLRLLQEKKVTPLGSNTTISVDCRIICATNENIEELMRKGKFREDLYFRIKRAVLHIPPLRQRREDIPDLVEYFLQKYALGTKRLSSGAMRLCLEYNWPGNIRQLEGALETVAKMQDGNEITEDDLKTQIFPSTGSWESEGKAGDQSTGQLIQPSFRLTPQMIHRKYKHLVRRYEQELVTMAVQVAKTEKATAEFLGLPRSTLVSKRKTWGWKELDGQSEE